MKKVSQEEDYTMALRPKVEREKEGRGKGSKGGRKEDKEDLKR